MVKATFASLSLVLAPDHSSLQMCMRAYTHMRMYMMYAHAHLSRFLASWKLPWV